MNSIEVHTASERNEGIELFRCVSMILILILHIIHRGGVLTYSGGHIEQYRVVRFLETVSYCSVDCYALISGYVNKEHDFRISRFVLRWLEVFFWLFIPLVITKLFITEINVDSYVSATFAPLTSKTLWYFNACILLFPFIPILNIGLECIGKRNHELILIFLFITTCTLHVFNGGDNFVLSGGYCGMWLIILYVFGAYFKLYGIPKWAKWYVSIPLFFTSAVLAWSIKMHQIKLVKDNVIKTNDSKWSILDRFVSYTSPFMVIMSLCLLLFFANVSIKPRIIMMCYQLLDICFLSIVGLIDLLKGYLREKQLKISFYREVRIGNRRFYVRKPIVQITKCVCVTDAFIIYLELWRTSADYA